MQEAKQTSNAVRLLYLGWMIGQELEDAVRLDPAMVDARMDLVRFYVMAPRIVGGGVPKAKREAREIARRNPALGAFASGYIAYRQKEYGPARKRLQEAVRLASDPGSRILALTWLGYLSQETQQYADAFASFRAILAIDPAHREALYEIGRTAVFSGLEREAGEAALREYLRGTPGDDMPSAEDARKQLERLLTQPN
jgi:tetratricopeptide (TPR) repeat protein